MEEGIVMEFGMDMYTLLELKKKINKDLLYITLVLFSVIWQPGWEGSWGENMYGYIHIWIHAYPYIHG